MSSEKTSHGKIKPRIIIHGGAGNITHGNLPNERLQEYRGALLDSVGQANSLLSSPHATAIDVACFAVELLENNPLFNAGHGAVFTTGETHELEASVMVSRGYRKRGVGVMNITRAKNPIKLAKEMLIKGELDDGGGAQGHCQLQGKICDELVEKWGLESVKPSYFWTKKRWDEHRKGLGKDCDSQTYKRHKKLADGKFGLSLSEHRDSKDTIETDDIGWDGREYLPQGTVGAVVLDRDGTICVATSTGGLTNKLPGRVGDTPTIGAGFFAEEWVSTSTILHTPPTQPQSALSLAAMMSDCIPGLSGYMSLPPPSPQETKTVKSTRAVAMSGTGNGDSFLRVSAARTAAAMVRFSQSQNVSLQDAVTQVAGPDGMLQKSAEDRWHKTGEGEGGIIGIELKSGKGEIVFDFNCGGMFHAWVDENGKAQFEVFHSHG